MLVLERGQGGGADGLSSQAVQPHFSATRKESAKEYIILTADADLNVWSLSLKATARLAGKVHG